MAQLKKMMNDLKKTVEELSAAMAANFSQNANGGHGADDLAKL